MSSNSHTMKIDCYEKFVNTFEKNAHIKRLLLFILFLEDCTYLLATRYLSASRATFCFKLERKQTFDCSEGRVLLV